MTGPGAAQVAVTHLGIGHLGGTFGNGNRVVVHRLDGRVRPVAQVVPHGSFRGHHVGLVAAVGNHVVGSLRGRQVFPLEVPANVHQLYRIEGAAAPPGSTGAVGRFSLKSKFHGNHAVAAAVPVAGAQVTAHVGKDAGINVLEVAVAYVKSLGAQLLFGDPRPQDQRTRIFSRSMSFLRASTAVTLSGCPELCPSPCPGAPSTIGSW
jgi:hypothetical protein